MRNSTAVPSLSRNPTAEEIAAADWLSDDDRQMLLEALAIREADLDVDSELAVSVFWSALRAIRRLRALEPVEPLSIDVLTIEQVIAWIGKPRRARKPPVSLQAAEGVG